MISVKSQVTIEFPCSDADWDSLVQMRALTCGKVSAPIVATLTTTEEKIIETLSKKQEVTAEELLDTAFLDYCNNNSIAGCKPNVSQLIRDFTDTHPGCTRQECVNTIVKKYKLHPGKVGQGINNLTHKKNLSRIGDRLYPV